MTCSSPFGIYGDQKVTVFIDGTSLYAAASTLSFMVDYKKIHSCFEGKCRFVRANFYTAAVQGAEYDSIRQLVDWLEYNKYTLKRKMPKEYTDANGRQRLKGSVTVEMAIDMLEAAKYSDHIVLFSGDGDFVAAVEAIKRLGVRVTVASTILSTPACVSDDLRRAADDFVDIGSGAVRPLIERQQVAGRAIITRAVA